MKVLLDDRTFDKGGHIVDAAPGWAGNGLATCPHEDHRRQRRLIQPAFHRAKMPGYAAAMTAIIDGVTTSWRDGESIVPSEKAYAISVRAVASTLFSAVIDDAIVADLHDCIGVVFTDGYRQMLKPGPLAKMPTPANRRYERAKAILDSIVNKIISDYKHQDEDHGDVLSILLDTQRTQNGDAMTDEEIFAQVLNLLAAGVDIAASAIAWACHLLAAHRDLQERVRDEAHGVLHGRAAGWEDIPLLPLVGRVVTETLRLHSPDPCGHARHRTRRPPAARRLHGHLQPVPPASPRRPVSRPGEVRPGPMAGRGWRRIGGQARGFHAVQRRQPPVHRKGFRRDRGGPRGRHPRRPLAS
jgi:pentalenene oxygenase